MARTTRNNRLQRIGLFVIVGLIAIAFVLVFGQPSSGRGPDVVAEIDGESVARDVFESARDQIEAMQRPLLPPGLDDAGFEQQLDVAALDSVLRLYIMAAEARSLGLQVSEAEIRDEICSAPLFLRNGRCDRELLAAHVSRNYDSERSFTEQLGRELLVRKLFRLASSPIRVADASVDERLRRERLEVRLRYVALRGQGFLERAQVTDEEAAALAEAEPERLRAAYERRLAEFVKPEEVRARHILFVGQEAMERAERVRLRIEAGEDFGKLASELSEDPATRALGGDLGFFPRGRMLEEFEAAAFGAEDGTLVGPVASEQGAHLIRVEERREGVERSLEEVSLEVAGDLLRSDRSTQAARAAAEQMAALLREGRAFEEAAEAIDVPVEETLLFRPAEPFVPGIGRPAGLRQTAAELTPEEPDSDRIFASGDAFYLISLASRSEPAAEALETDRDAARERMLREAREQVLSAWYRARRRELTEDGRLEHFPLYPN